MVHAGGERLTGLHYGTYDYSAFTGIAAAYQSLEHPVADHAKLVMQAAAAGTGVRLSDGSTNVLPVGDAEDGPRGLGEPPPAGPPLAGARLLPGLGPAPGPAADAVRRDVRLLPRGTGSALDRLEAYVGHVEGAIADEPATARALARYVLRGVDCGAVDEAEVRGLDLRLPSSRVAAWPTSWEPTSTARRRTASSASSGTPRATRSATSTCRRRCAASFADAHTTGDQAQVLPTDTQKNTAFAYAKLHGIDSIEDYALALGRRLMRGVPGRERGPGAGRGVRLGPDR